MTTQSSLVVSDLRVGILSNTPVKPSRGEDADYVACAEVEEQVEAVDGALEKLGLERQRFRLGEDAVGLVRELKEYGADVIVNLCEGAFGDSNREMHVPALLELAKIPYTGSPPLSLGLCQNKGFTKSILRAAGLATPQYQVVQRYDEWRGDIGYPLFVKPLSEDASLGITRRSFVRDAVALKERVEYVLDRYQQPALVERYIAGRELNVPILGNAGPRVLPIAEIEFTVHDEPKIVDYPAKWVSDSDEYRTTVPVCPANLEPLVRTRVEEAALHAYATLYCRDYARIDVRLQGETPYVLEVNPNPDIAPDAGFARSLSAAGIAYEAFVAQIIGFALERNRSRAFE